MKFINLAFSDLMEAIARKYFVESKKEHYWRCICGKEKKCAPKSGWTNLISHIRKQHPEQNFAKSDENYHQQKITNAFGGTTLGADSGDFASEILKKKRKVAAKSSYIDTRFIQPTSNMVERFFSSAGFAASELRQNISPVHLEEQLYLKANKRFWNVQLVNEVFNC